MGEDPAASWLTYLIIGVGFILGASIALVVKMGREEDDLTTQEQLFDEKEHVDFAANLEQQEPNTMIPLNELPPIPGNEMNQAESGAGGESVD